MEQKMVRVPFNVEMAKKITEKSVYGKIVTRNGRNARIICFDAHCDDNIVALIEDEQGVEYPKCYVSNGYTFGYTFLNGESDSDLILEIPEYVTFKEGDVIVVDRSVLLFSGDVNQYDLCGCYCSLFADTKSLDLNFDYKGVFPETRLATEEEKQMLINELKASKEPKAKEYLKMLGIKVKTEYKFNPKDWVLCKSGGEWCLCRFSHKMVRFDGVLMYVTVGGIAYEYCIPYNEQTAHLIGTTDNWEE